MNKTKYDQIVGGTAVLAIGGLILALTLGGDKQPIEVAKKLSEMPTVTSYKPEDGGGLSIIRIHGRGGTVTETCVYTKKPIQMKTGQDGELVLADSVEVTKRTKTKWKREEKVVVAEKRKF